MAQAITDILGQLRGGYALHEASKRLDEAVRAVRATGKKGSVTLTIDIMPDKTDDRIIKMQPSVKAKIPEKGFSEGIFFVAPDGRLTKEDPAQLELLEERQREGVRSIAAGEKALSEVGRG